ncbi:hypothetical protein Aduo_019937 [Ancylostoma duodenale]
MDASNAVLLAVKRPNREFDECIRAVMTALAACTPRGDRGGLKAGQRTQRDGAGRPAFARLSLLVYTDNCTSCSSSLHQHVLNSCHSFTPS